MQHGYLLPSCLVNRAAPLNRGIGSWWKHLPNRLLGGGSTLRDIASTNHGTLVGPLWSGRTHFGGWGSLSYDGTDDIVNCGACRNLDLTGDWTIALKAYARTFGTNEVKGLLSKRDAFGTLSWECFYDTGAGASSGGMNFWFGNFGSFKAFESAGITGTVNTWQDWAITRSGSTFSLYRDGLLMATDTDANAIPANGDSIRIGTLAGDALSSLTVWDGFIDDIVICPSIAWSASHIAARVQVSRQSYPNELNWITRPVVAAEQGGAATYFPWHYYQQMMAG